MANFIMTNWYIKDKTPYVVIGTAGENNATSISIECDDNEIIENAEYFLDIGDTKNDIFNTQELTVKQQITPTGETTNILYLKPMRSFLGKEGVKLLQVRCEYIDNDEKVIKESNVFHAIVNKNTGFIYKFDIAIFQQYLNKVKELAAKVAQDIANLTLGDLKDTNIVDPTDGQIIKYDAETQKWINGEGGGSGGSSNYNELSNKPRINNVVLSGNKTTSDLGINIPTKTSDLTNDNGFITIEDVPTKTSELTNDSHFVVDAHYVHTDNNYDTTAKNIVDGVTSALDGKVDKVSGKGLSTNDYTNADKAIVSGVTSALESKANIADLASVATSGDYDDLSDRPSINNVVLSGNKSTSDLGINIPTKTSDLTNDSNFVVDANYVHTDNNYTNTDKTIVDGVTNALASKANVADLATVATTGDYEDLSNKPSIPEISVTQTLQSGTKIGSISVDGISTDLFAPNGGSGSGDMLQSVYDPNGTVADAGGIVEYVNEHGSSDLPWVTPQDFGAVGDGVTDDTDAIIAAETAANNSTKILYFPAGTYKVRVNQIYCHAGMTWFGDNNKSIIVIDPTTAENGAMIFGGQSGISDSGSNITIHDLIFRGTETFGTSANGVKLFALWNGNNCLFYNCVFQNNKNLALCLISSNKINIHDCRFEATDCGIEAMGNDAVCDVTIRDCYFSGISSYNGWKNVSSEPISSYCGKNNTSPNERWVIENCIFEHKSTNAILFSASGSPSMSDGVINNKDVVIRSCTFRGVAGCIKIEKSENVLVDDIFLDDTTKDVAATANINSIVRIEGSKNITVKNVTSKCQQISFNALGTDAYCDNILFENIDSYAPNRTSSEPFAIFKGNNIIVKNTLVHPIATSNKVIYINFDQLTNSSIDIDCTKEEGGIVVYFINSGNTTVYSNNFIINTDVDIRRNIPYSTSVADANNWILKGNGSLTFTALTSVNRQQPKRSYVINVNNSSQFDALDDTTDFALMQNDYEFYLDFISSAYSAGKSFSLNNTGNIIPINQPIIFSNDYKVVCRFVQKNAKWVEVERILEYYEGADVDIDDPSTDIDFATLLGGE